MRTLILRGLMLIIIMVLVILITMSVLSNTQIRIEGSSSQDGRMMVETQLPQAQCSKELSTTFPFVRFRCTPHEP